MLFGERGIVYQEEKKEKKGIDARAAVGKLDSLQRARGRNNSLNGGGKGEENR